ncbi:Rne/Rng family ribonuclease [Anthocerotibacter panamensis]|uniref:Rne/Rng family ribonuclease n=1 Tax=Anthocerotibacter panamensis TaxID=2857077 RepID=UPI00247A6AC2|nr:Rne/Rng family ribonuclease [Anthocerotibacter panamensis]
MPKQIIIAEQHRLAAVFSEEQIQELIVAKGSHQVGDIYLGVVENVLPSIDAAFVNIGNAERNGFIHVTDLGPIRQRRNSASITELVVPQQKVLVQVMKEPTGNKGPRLTGNITLPGRFLVLMPSGRGVNLSRRIRDEDQRHRLRALAILIKPEGMGLLVRTEAEGVDEQSIIDDLEALKQSWEKIQQKMQVSRAPAMLNRDEDFIQRVLRDTYTSQVNRIVVDSAFGQKRVKQYLIGWNGGRMPQGLYVEHHRENTQILEYYRVNAAIREALKPRVDLPSGGYVVIQPTEALVVIDVNSGSFTRSATSRETVLWTNCEAATEIARQLRLRNVAGVIIVDFIDMESRRDQLQVLEHFSKALKADKAHPQIAQLTELGLVELTRKRQGQSLYEVFGRPCPTCDGLGLLATLPGEKESIPDLVVASREISELSDSFTNLEEEDFTGGYGSDEDSDEEEGKDSDKGESLVTPHPTFRMDRRGGRNTGSTRSAPSGRGERSQERTSERPVEGGRSERRQIPDPATRPEEASGRGERPDRSGRRRHSRSPANRSPRPEANTPQLPTPPYGTSLPPVPGNGTPPPVPPMFPDQTPPPAFFSPMSFVEGGPPVAPPPTSAPPAPASVVESRPVELEPEEIEPPLLVPPLVVPPPPLTPAPIQNERILINDRESSIVSVLPSAPPVSEEPPPNRRRRRRTKGSDLSTEEGSENS